MRIKAFRIIIRSLSIPSLWYRNGINEQFWAENVGGDFPWKIIQEGPCPSFCPLYVHKEDAEPLRESWVDIDLIQTVKECSNEI